MLVTLRRIQISPTLIRPSSRQFRVYGVEDPSLNRIGMGSYEDQRTPEGLRIMRADALVDSSGHHWTHWSAIVDSDYKVRYIHRSNPEKNELRRGSEQDRAIDIAMRTSDFLDPNRIGDGIWRQVHQPMILHTSLFNTGRDFQSLSSDRKNDMEIHLVLASSNEAADDALVLNHPAVKQLLGGSAISTDTDKRGRWYLAGRCCVLVAHDAKGYTVTLVNGTKQAVATNVSLEKALDAAGKARFVRRKDL